MWMERFSLPSQLEDTTCVTESLIKQSRKLSALIARLKFQLLKDKSIRRKIRLLDPSTCGRAAERVGRRS